MSSFSYRLQFPCNPDRPPRYSRALLQPEPGGNTWRVARGIFTTDGKLLEEKPMREGLRHRSAKRRADAYNERHPAP